MRRVETVIKVGGSLLDWSELPTRLLADLEARGGARAGLLLIAGGGPAADVIRALDQTHGLGATQAHRLAIRSLDLTAHVLAAIVPGLVVLEDMTGPADAWDAGRFPVLVPRPFLESEERDASTALPHGWHVTSDTIAARIASRIGARCLVLLKSASLPNGADVHEAAKIGLVDAAFPNEARRPPRVYLRDLRDPDSRDQPL
jgi:aspartokinase-like uncharacterized kinase